MLIKTLHLTETLNQEEPSHSLPILATNYKFFAAYLGLIILMTISLVALVKVKEIQRKKVDVPESLTIDN
jgi:hypothetical protein